MATRKGYSSDLTDDERALIEGTFHFRPIETEIAKRPDTARGFEVLPRRWVVERTFG